jgi:PTS system nitrogen regulatory IIA component
MYLNVVELAESLGVEESVIENWVRDEGLPHVPDRGRLLFDRAQVVAWAASRGLTAKLGFLAPQLPSTAIRRLEPLLRAGGIWRDVASSQALAVVEEIVGNLPGETSAVRRLLVQRLHEPNGVNWAPVGGGLALPHLRAPAALGRGVIALLFLRDPLLTDPPAPDSSPVTRLLFFMAPSPRMHLEMLGQLSTALTGGSFRLRILEAAPDAEIFAALSAADAAQTGQQRKGAGA